MINLCFTILQHVDLSALNLLLINLEFSLTAFAAHRTKRIQTPKKLIEEIDVSPPTPPRCPSGKLKIQVRLSNQTKATPITPAATRVKSLAGVLPTPRVGTSPLVKSPQTVVSPSQGENQLFVILKKLYCDSKQLNFFRSYFESCQWTAIARLLGTARSAPRQRER